MRRAILLMLPLVMLLAGCPVPFKGEVPKGGKKYMIDPATGNAFWMYVPKKYDHDTPAPVIVSCHGTPPYDVAEHHIRTWEWYGEKYGCIIICPDLQGTDGIFGAGPIGGMLHNERVILSIISSLCYKYNIDRSNIMITGFSGGGFPAYWVGLRHPDVFSAIVPQNCNFNRSSIDGWYPPQARKIDVMIYYGEFDPAPIVIQSKHGIEYLKSHGFKVKTKVIPGGHDRHPEVAMAFFRKSMSKRPANGTLASLKIKKGAKRRNPTKPGYKYQPPKKSPPVKKTAPRTPTTTYPDMPPAP